MKAVVLSGGDGRRMQPFTSSMPKQLLPVAGRPVLQRLLETLAGAGVHEVAVVVGSWAPEVRRAIGDGSASGVCVTYIEQPTPAGLAHAVGLAQEFLGDEDFVLALGDNLFGEDAVSDLLRLAATRPACGLLVREVGDPRAYGVAEVTGEGRVLRVLEKPSQPPTNLAVTGMYYFSSLVHASIATLTPSPRGELEITDAIQDLIGRGHRVEAHRFEGYWRDIGHSDDVVLANGELLGELERDIAGEVDDTSTVVGDVVVEAGAEVHGSHIVGPALVRSWARLTDCVVGPGTTIGEGACLTGVHLENSVVLAGTRLQLATGLRGCVIAPQDHPVQANPRHQAAEATVGAR
ncbi:MAG: sugar phosphate nucleotidyltransferase [Knoellia sp.]